MPHLRRFLRQYVLPLWRWYVPATLAVLLTNWLAVRIPATLAVGLDALRAGGVGPAGTTVTDAALHIGLYGASIIVIRSLSRIWFFTPARLAEFTLREDLFAHLLRLQPSFYAKYPTGDLLSRATSDVTFARAFAGFALLQAVNVIAALSMALAQMVSTSAPLTIAAAIPIFAGYAVAQGGASRLFGMQRMVQAQVATFSDGLLGAITGVATIQAFCAEDAFVARLNTMADAMRRTNVQLAALRAVVFPLLTVAGGVSIFLLLALGGPMVVAGAVSPGELAAFIALVGYLIVPLRLLGVLLPVFQRAEASLERIHVILDSPVERPERGQEQPFPTPGRGPAIELRHLTWAFPDAPETPVLRDISVTLPAGASVGIFGRTGAGKTTLLRLLARLQNPPPGTVFVGGIDITRLDLDDLRRHLVMVPQVSFLFGETVRENVGLGAPDARIREAVAAAALTPDLAALPDGLETVVGERGIVLSGGQRQRVALARGLARDGEIVLLDDVLSAVDHHTEQQLIDMLEGRGGSTGRGAAPGGETRPTRILVSHRMSALERCDVVLVIDAGRVVDVGTHATLVEQAGIYRDAWMVQRTRPDVAPEASP